MVTPSGAVYTAHGSIGGNFVGSQEEATGR